MLGIVDADFSRSDKLQDMLAQYRFASFVVNATGDAGSRSLINAADMLIVETNLLPVVLSLRREFRNELNSTDDLDIAVAFSESPGARYYVVMRPSVMKGRPDWRLFTVQLGFEPEAPNFAGQPRFPELKLAG
jgi:hypothetical protein